MSNDIKALIAEYREAKAELERISKRDRYESNDYLRQNRRVAELEQQIPWHRR